MTLQGLSFLSGYGLFKAVPTKKGDLLSREWPTCTFWLLPSGLVPEYTEGLFKLADPRDSGWFRGPLLAHLSSPWETWVIDLIRSDSGSPGASEKYEWIYEL